MNDIVMSVRRTVVPAIAGLIIAGLVAAGFDIDSDALNQVVDGLFVGVYYLLLRILERANPMWGVLLGGRKQPSY